MIDANFKLKVDSKKDDYGKFSLEPLPEGYGHTLGNALRRVLLSSLKGAAITSVKISGAKHPFSTLPGVKEDVVELILNLKNIRLKLFDKKEAKMKLKVSGVKEVKAGNIETPGEIEIVNKDLYLCSLSDKKAELEIEFTVSSGVGYKLAEAKKDEALGVIPVDASFSPVKRVNYKVESTRVGRLTNLDKLIMEIWTDKSIQPQKALEEAAKILNAFFVQVFEPKVETAEPVAVTPAISEEILKMFVEELDLPTRICNSLKNGGIETVGQLLGTPKKDLNKIKNLGAKSISIIEEKLREKGVALTV